MQNQMRLVLLLSLTVIFGSECVIADSVVKQRPNVILIMADDLGFECIGCNGSEQYKTPVLDQLAKDGMRFTQCHAQPLCTPSRVKLMTGLSNARNYSAFSVLPRDQKTIGQYFNEAGYQTCIAGKWQLLGAEHYSTQFRGMGTYPEYAGFDSICLWQVDKLGSRFFAPLMYVNGKNVQFEKDHYGPAVATDHIINFISENRDRPFFVYYPMILTHSPFVPTPLSKIPTEKSKQSNFEDMVHYMDYTIGRISKTISNLGIDQNTLLVFVGDNGTHSSIQSEFGNRKVRGGKAKTTNAGTHVPMIAHWPKTIKAGSTNDNLIDLSDFLPTLMDATGIAKPDHLDGVSFMHQLRNGEGRDREWIYCYYNPRPEKTKPSYFVRDKRFKLYGDGRFYDLQSDVLEKTDIPNPDGPALTAYKKLQAALASMPNEGSKLLKFPE